MFPKISFSFALLSFCLPFLLVTCNDKNTHELVPLIMQSQEVENKQGWSLLVEPLTTDNLSNGGLLGGGSRRVEKIELHLIIMQWVFRLLLVLILIVSLRALFRLATKSFPENNQEPSIKSAYWGLWLLLGFMVTVEIGEFLIDEKIGSSSFGLEFGYGSGFYLCCLSFLSVVLYYKWFLTKYIVHRIDVQPEEPKERDETPDYFKNLEL